MSQPKTLFEKLANNEISSRKIWEDDQYMAFLTPFPNTPGVIVVAPKANLGDDAFDLEDEDYQQLLQVSRMVAQKLKKALAVSRVALVIEGTGVPHVHIKLYPLHGKLGESTNVWPSHQEFYPEYAGYLTTVEGPKMADEELDKIWKQIKGVF